MKLKYLSFTLFGLYAMIYLTQFVQFLMLDDIEGPYAFLISMFVFNIMFLIITRQQTNILALIISSLYTLWYMIIFFTITYDGVSVLSAIDVYFIIFKRTFVPESLHALTNYFSNAIAVSVYIIPYVFMLNLDFLKQSFKK